jgi:FtsP/CotA-like multicopper oxidase with cupredoxin domain
MPLHAEVCPRPETGGVALAPPEIAAVNGELRAVFAFRSEIDENGLTRYCYIYKDSAQAPTLRVGPGDEVVIDLKNELPAAVGMPAMHDYAGGGCTAGPMTALSTNLHFHGLEIPPVCHQDEVVHTLVQPAGPAFQYRFRIPARQPPGLYWYHPHPHGFSEAQVLGGASGAMIVEGIAERKTQVRGLPERVLILRDQLNPIAQYRKKSKPADQDDPGGKDLSLNFTPIVAPLFIPAVLRVTSARREFWRVLNASADTYFDLQLVETQGGGRVPHDLQLIAMDGAPVSGSVTVEPRTAILLAPGARAEFIVTMPAAGAFAQLVTRSYDTGPDGAANGYRVLANLLSAPVDKEPRPVFHAPAREAKFTGLIGLKPARVRKLYFSEDLTPGRPPKYFITVEGRQPAVFDMNFKVPDITVRQGTIEDWVIENRAREAHAFHIHQLHFQLLERDGARIDEPMLRDTIDLPFRDGKSEAYPSVKLRMDFRSPDIVGTFLFHCHILEHEDAGMMGSIKVVK